jgi:hypothetical protein
MMTCRVKSRSNDIRREGNMSLSCLDAERAAINAEQLLASPGFASLHVPLASGAPGDI